MISLPPMAHYSGHIAHNESWWVQRALVVDFQLVIVIKSFQIGMPTAMQMLGYVWVSSTQILTQHIM